MAKINIDGVTYEYSEYAEKYQKLHGKQPMLLQFALDSGVEIPYFCYHPAMSLPTNCRMCLCEVGFPVKDKEGQLVLEADGSPKINWGRKPATSCNQALVPDMFVRTNATSGVVDKAQKGVLEFILINHPLDCPICDQAGECPLQINTYKYGPEGSRFELAKVHKPKRINLGPRVKLDAERCINCTRCTRFTHEVSKTDQLSIIARGDKNFPSAGPGKAFDDPYSMNTIDICPVGALTSEDFRFKARVWEMNYTPSICTGCAQGCNIDVWIRDNAVMRLTPRANVAVNQYWMCDEGRLDYHKFNESRVSGIKQKGDLPVDMAAGLAEVLALLNRHAGKILFIGSAYASAESNYALKKLANKFGSNSVQYVSHNSPGWGDNFLRKDDRTPNAAACRALGFKETSWEELKKQATTAELVYIVEDDSVAARLVAETNTPVVAHAYNHFAGHEKAAYILPAATVVESNGTYININNIAQVALQAKQVRRMTPEMWMQMPKSRLDAGGVAVDNWRNTDNIIDCLPSWMMIGKMAELAGFDFAYLKHNDIFTKVQTEIEPMRGLKLPKRPRKEAFKMSQFEFAIN